MDDKKIKLMLKKKENKKRMRELWYKIMKPLANFLIRIDDRIYTYKENKIKKKVDSLTLEEVAEKACDLIVEELVDYNCVDGIYIAIADWCSTDYCTDIMNYISSRLTKKDSSLYRRWINKNSKFCNNLELNEKLTIIVENNLQNSSIVEIKHVFIDRLKYDYASCNYKKTVIFKLKEVE